MGPAIITTKLNNNVTTQHIIEERLAEMPTTNTQPIDGILTYYKNRLKLGNLGVRVPPTING